MVLEVHPATVGDCAVGNRRHRRAATRHLGVEVDQVVSDLTARHLALEGGALMNRFFNVSGPRAICVNAADEDVPSSESGEDCFFDSIGIVI
jgi:hypothetical protein